MEGNSDSRAITDQFWALTAFLLLILLLRIIIDTDTKLFVIPVSGLFSHSINYWTGDSAGFNVEL